MGMKEALDHQCKSATLSDLPLFSLQPLVLRQFLPVTGCLMFQAMTNRENPVTVSAILLVKVFPQPTVPLEIVFALIPFAVLMQFESLCFTYFKPQSTFLKLYWQLTCRIKSLLMWCSCRTYQECTFLFVKSFPRVQRAGIRSTFVNI